MFAARGRPTLESEALRVNARYVDEAVVGWGLCPWAALAWRTGAVRRQVFAEAVPLPEAVAAFMDALRAEPTISIGLAIFARAADDAAAWARFAERVRRCDRMRATAGAPAFVVAAFHPDPAGDASAGSAAALVAHVRRTPDPTLQVVRASALDAATGGDPRVSAEVTDGNFRRFGGERAAAFRALLDDIRRDRNAAYAAL